MQFAAPSVSDGKCEKNILCCSHWDASRWSPCSYRCYSLNKLHRDSHGRRSSAGSSSSSCRLRCSPRLDRHIISQNGIMKHQLHIVTGLWNEREHICCKCVRVSVCTNVLFSHLYIDIFLKFYHKIRIGGIGDIMNPRIRLSTCWDESLVDICFSQRRTPWMLYVMLVMPLLGATC